MTERRFALQVGVAAPLPGRRMQHLRSTRLRAVCLMCFTLSLAVAAGTMDAHAQTADFAPPNEQAFEDRFVGGRVDIDKDLNDVTIAGQTLDLLESHVEILPGRRYREVKRVQHAGDAPINVGIGVIRTGDRVTVQDSGRYSYRRTGPNTGRITIIFDGGASRFVDGELEMSEFGRGDTCHVDMTFSSGVHGRIRVLGTGNCNPMTASWRIAGSDPDSESAEPGDTAFVIPLFTPAGDVHQGLARVINHSERSGTVRIYGTDDAGRRFGPVTLLVDAGATRHLDARDLESGNASKGLSEGLGDGSGSWRLRLATDLDIEVGAYLQTPDGLLSAVHDVVRTLEVGGETVHHVPIFNGADDRSHASWLRVSNLTDAGVEVTIRGRDDDGEPAPGGEVHLTLPARATRRISAPQLELGDAGLDGRLGDGEGRWRLSLTADGEIEVVSLLRSAAGHVANLSGSGLRPAHVSTSRQAVGTAFRDCAGCPEMVVVPAGSYRMGSPADETGRDPNEGPVHEVTVSDPFAVGRFEVTFAEWDACHADGGCSRRPDDQGWGRGDQPVVDVSWRDAGEYVRWLSARTGRWYRLLSESEWEYVARAGSATRYWWGDEVGRNRANCDGCGSRWDARQTAPVGSFSPNAFGLHDVHGNVWEWVQDCWNDSYDGAPDDGSAWESGLCGSRVVRGGSWQSGTIPRYVRAAKRGWNLALYPTFRNVGAVGFRVARSLSRPARHVLPLFPPAGSVRQGVARITNRSDRSGTVHVRGTDNAGRWLSEVGPFELSLNAGETVHLFSDDLSDVAVPAGLEGGNGFEWLAPGSDAGQGSWRLVLLTDLDIEPSAYIRTPDGFLTAMHDVVRSTEVDGATVHRVPIFNPASNRNQASWLHVANPTRDSVEVTIRGRDDAGHPAPGGEVRLTLPAREARRISAEQLESGDLDFSGRLGDGEGRWQLLVTADGAIEVVNLLQSATGHLTNLSTTARNEFEIVAGGPATVRPLQTIYLTVPRGLGDSDYTVLMDLSGTGEFPEDDTAEIEGLTTEDGRILFASPLTQILPEANASNRLVVRVRREADQAISNVLHYSIDDITSLAGPPGFPTMVLEAIRKSIYATVDDPLLNLKAASIQPGLVAFSAARLGVDLTFSDVLAEATMQSLLGVPVTELAPPLAAPAPASSHRADDASRVSLFSERSVVGQVAAGHGAGYARQMLAAPADTAAGDVAPSLLCKWLGLVDRFGICGTTEKMQAVVKKRNENRRECKFEDDDLGQCLAEEKNRDQKARIEVTREFGRGVIEGIPKGLLKIGARGPITRFLGQLGIGKGGSTIIRKGVAHPAINELVGTMHMKESGEMDVNVGRAQKAPDDDEETAKSVELLKAFFQYHKQRIKELIPEAEREIAALPNFDADARESYSVVMNDVDRQLREAETIDDLEAYYRGEKELREAIGNDPNRGMAAAADCKLGYREFPLEDGKTSTCVLESLVEENCYPGSRPPSDVDLGGSGACLYYSRDRFQPDGSCRENYDRVQFQGQWTCRWAELGPEEPAWYTLHEVEEEPKQALRTPEEIGEFCRGSFGSYYFSYQDESYCTYCGYTPSCDLGSWKASCKRATEGLAAAGGKLVDCPVVAEAGPPREKGTWPGGGVKITVPPSGELTIALTDYIEDPDGGPISFAVRDLHLFYGWDLAINGGLLSATRTSEYDVSGGLVITATDDEGYSEDFQFWLIVEDYEDPGHIYAMSREDAERTCQAIRPFGEVDYGNCVACGLSATCDLIEWLPRCDRDEPPYCPPPDDNVQSRTVSIDTFRFNEPAGCEVTGFGVRNTLTSKVIEVSGFDVPREAEACRLAVKSARITCEQAIFHQSGKSINEACPATAAVQQERQRCWDHFTGELAKCGPASN